MHGLHPRLEPARSVPPRGATALVLLALGGCSARTLPLVSESDTGATAGASTGENTTTTPTTTTNDGFGQLTTACGETHGVGDAPTSWRPTEGCPAAWPYSKIRGPGPSGEDDFVHAVFGYTTYYPGEDFESYGGPQLRFFMDSIDPGSPTVHVWELGYGELNEWLGEYSTQIWYNPNDAPGEDHTYDAIIEICSYAGNWQAYDPADPPRLLGQMRAQGSGFQGTFDAVFCDDWYNETWPD